MHGIVMGVFAYECVLRTWDTGCKVSSKIEWVMGEILAFIEKMVWFGLNCIGLA